LATAGSPLRPTGGWSCVPPRSGSTACRLNGKQASKPDFQWGELKKRLSIVDGKVIDTETGEFVEAVAVEAVPPKFIVEV